MRAGILRAMLTRRFDPEAKGVEGMLCQKCKKNEATIHMTQIVNGNKREIHLCEECAAMSQGVKVIPIVTLDQWLNHIISAAHAGLTAEEDEHVCPDCGITYGEFRSGGRLGCPACYQPLASPWRR